MRDKSLECLGPNGVGKSTIFNLLTGLIKPSTGKIKINGKDAIQLSSLFKNKEI